MFEHLHILTLTLFLLAKFCEPHQPDEAASQSQVTTPENRSPAQCPPPEDPSIFDVPDKHIGNLVSKYHKAIEHYCNDCPKCIRENRDTYMHHFDMWYPRPCWGYEDCEENQHFQPMPICESNSMRPLSKSQKVALFYRQGDFGYIRKVRNEMQFLCWPDPRGGYDAWLQCSKHLQFCSGHMVRLDMRALAHRDTPVRYHMDVLKIGEISETENF